MEFKQNAGKEESKSLRPDKKKAAEGFKKIIEENKDKGKYDCLLLFSGGKDSSYLLYLLAKEYGLNTLAVTVDVGVLTSLAKENIKRVPEKLGVDHVFVEPEKEFLKKLFRYYMFHPNKPTLTSSICEVCQNLMRSSGIIMAVEKKIPIVTMAYNENEARGLEMPNEKIQESWVPKHLYDEPFNEKDRKYFWDPKRYNKQDIPRFVYPYWATGFPGVEFIIKRLEELGLASKKQSNPLYTNCWFHWLTMYLDFNMKGHNPYYRLQYDLIRRKQVGRTKLYLFFTVGAWLFKNGFYNGKTIKKGLNYLDLKMEDFPKKS
jgi:hypothetical protein